jgi:peptide-methionine (S)-S-oxide reductase
MNWRNLLCGLMLTAVAGGAAAQTKLAEQPARSTATAIFAGGCFWCVESDFDKVPGVISTMSGYTGGQTTNPTYEQVSAGGTGHAEAVRVVYDPATVTYDELLKVFWRNVDPVTANAQFCDHGSQYRSAIFVGSKEEKSLAEASRASLQASGRFKKPIVTEIVAASAFYPAEEYHQDYYVKNPLKYKFYRTTCGRDARLRELWGNEAGGHGS